MGRCKRLGAGLPKMKRRFKINCNGILFLLRRIMAGKQRSIQEGTNGKCHRRIG
jgi:hypothetical protein